jgi:hypothetical protein
MHELIWITVLDHRYVVAVTRTGPYQGELTVADGFEIAYCRSIDLTYNALLGPDVSDIAEWRRMACAFVDSRLEN